MYPTYLTGVQDLVCHQRSHYAAQPVVWSWYALTWVEDEWPWQQMLIFKTEMPILMWKEKDVFEWKWWWWWWLWWLWWWWWSRAWRIQPWTLTLMPLISVGTYICDNQMMTGNKKNQLVFCVLFGRLKIFQHLSMGVLVPGTWSQEWDEEAKPSFGPSVLPRNSAL